MLPRALEFEAAPWNRGVLTEHCRLADFLSSVTGTSSVPGPWSELAGTFYQAGEAQPVRDVRDSLCASRRMAKTLRTDCPEGVALTWHAT